MSGNLFRPITAEVITKTHKNAQMTMAKGNIESCVPGRAMIVTATLTHAGMAALAKRQS